MEQHDIPEKSDASSTGFPKNIFDEISKKQVLIVFRQKDEKENQQQGKETPLLMIGCGNSIHTTKKALLQLLEHSANLPIVIMPNPIKEDISTSTIVRENHIPELIRAIGTDVAMCIVSGCPGDFTKGLDQENLPVGLIEALHENVEIFIEKPRRTYRKSDARYVPKTEKSKAKASTRFGRKRYSKK